MTIRVAGVEDAKVLAKLNAAVHKIHTDLFPKFFRKTKPAEFETLFRDWLANPDARALIAYDGEDPVGYVFLRIIKRNQNALVKKRSYVDIDQICVLKSKRRRGIAKRLLKETQTYAAKNGIREIQLNVWSANVVAVRAFRSMGFVTYNERMVLGGL